MSVLQCFTMLLICSLLPSCTPLSVNTLHVSPHTETIRNNPLRHHQKLQLQKRTNGESQRRRISQTKLTSSLVSLEELSSSLTSATSAAAAAMPLSIDASSVARVLGYVVGSGAVLLYTPIAIRIFRQQNADGLTLSTWWLKIVSYSCSIVYNIDRGYPISTYAETAVLSIESAFVLGLVAFYRNELFGARFGATALLYGTAVASALSGSVVSPEVLAAGQAGSAVINVVALLPQFALNARTRTAGDYSPVTASLASVGCVIRLFTTVQLADSDGLLLVSYGLAFVLNSSLLLQILYYGVRVEDRSLLDVLTADYAVRSDRSGSAGIGDRHER